jgi:dihydroflavonol-4-reductase
MKKVLVTGASGHLGNNLAILLAKRGYEVRASVRNPRDSSKIHYLQQRNIEIVGIELMDPHSITRAAVGVDCIFHTATPNTFWAKDPKKSIRDPIVKGSEYMMQAASAAGVKTVVFSSSCSAAGSDAVQGEPITESNWNLKTKMVLLGAKVEAERRVFKMAKNANIRLCSILMPNIIGPRCFRHTANTTVYEKLLRGRLPNLPPYGYHILDVRDAALAHVLAYENETASGRYIVAGRHFVPQELLNFLGEHIQKDFKGMRRILPSWAFKPSLPATGCDRRSPVHLDSLHWKWPGSILTRINWFHPIVQSQNSGGRLA